MDRSNGHDAKQDVLDTGYILLKFMKMINMLVVEGIPTGQGNKKFRVKFEGQK